MDSVLLLRMYAKVVTHVSNKLFGHNASKFLGKFLQRLGKSRETNLSTIVTAVTFSLADMPSMSVKLQSRFFHHLFSEFEQLQNTSIEIPSSISSSSNSKLSHTNGTSSSRPKTSLQSVKQIVSDIVEYNSGLKHTPNQEIEVHEDIILEAAIASEDGFDDTLEKTGRIEHQLEQQCTTVSEPVTNVLSIDECGIFDSGKSAEQSINEHELKVMNEFEPEIPLDTKKKKSVRPSKRKKTPQDDSQTTTSQAPPSKVVCTPEIELDQTTFSENPDMCKERKPVDYPEMKLTEERVVSSLLDCRQLAYFQAIFKFLECNPKVRSKVASTYDRLVRGSVPYGKGDSIDVADLADKIPSLHEVLFEKYGVDTSDFEDRRIPPFLLQE